MLICFHYVGLHVFHTFPTLMYHVLVSTYCWDVKIAFNSKVPFVCRLEPIVTRRMYCSYFFSITCFIHLNTSPKWYATNTKVKFVHTSLLNIFVDFLLSILGVLYVVLCLYFFVSTMCVCALVLLVSSSVIVSGQSTGVWFYISLHRLHYLVAFQSWKRK